MAQVIEVAIPDGVGPGEAFLVEFNGTQFNIGVPDGCEPGMLIQVEVPSGGDDPPADPPPDAAAGEAAPQLIEVAVPDGVGPGEAFLVDFDGTQFNITVPDGCGPGSVIQVEVPTPAETTAEAPSEPTTADPPEREMSNLKMNEGASSSNASRDSAGAGKSSSSSTSKGGSSSYSSSNPSSSSSSKKSGGYSTNYSSNYSSNYGTNYSSNYSSSKSNPFEYDYKYQSPKWEPEPSVFDGGFVLSGEAAEPCGDFAVGQLVQVTRSDGSWTYGKIMDYDAGGDTYTVQTKAGPKYFVERADITDDIVTNPSDGSCAQQ